MMQKAAQKHKRNSEIYTHKIIKQCTNSNEYERIKKKHNYERKLYHIYRWRKWQVLHNCAYALYFSVLESLAYIFATHSMGLSSFVFFCGRLRKHMHIILGRLQLFHTSLTYFLKPAVGLGYGGG